MSLDKLRANYSAADHTRIWEHLNEITAGVNTNSDTTDALIQAIHAELNGANKIRATAIGGWFMLDNTGYIYTIGAFHFIDVAIRRTDFTFTKEAGEWFDIFTIPDAVAVPNYRAQIGIVTGMYTTMVAQVEGQSRKVYFLADEHIEVKQTWEFRANFWWVA